MCVSLCVSLYLYTNFRFVALVDVLVESVVKDESFQLLLADYLEVIKARRGVAEKTGGMAGIRTAQGTRCKCKY